MSVREPKPPFTLQTGGNTEHFVASWLGTYEAQADVRPETTEKIQRIHEKHGYEDNVRGLMRVLMFVCSHPDVDKWSVRGECLRLHNILLEQTEESA